MDKYQQYILQKIGIEIDSIEQIKEYKLEEAECYLDIPNEVIIIEQSENCTIKKYNCRIYSNGDMGIDKIELLKEGKWIALERNEDYFKMQLDFDERAEKLRIVFVNDVAKPCELGIIYNEADKQMWDKKFKEITHEERIKKANVSHATGMDLVNIYFSPCCDEYAKTEVCLYKLNSDKNTSKQQQFIKKYAVENESHFLSIKGLAFAEYAFSLVQYDKNDKKLLETPKYSFSIFYRGYKGPYHVSH